MEETEKAEECLAERSEAVPMERISFASNRAIPEEAMRCIACDRPLPRSANVVCVFLDDRWTVWHRGCFVQRWRQEGGGGFVHGLQAGLR